MLFKNLRTGNMIAATDKISIELMQRSAIYEAVKTTPAPAPKAKDKAKTENKTE